MQEVFAINKVTGGIMLEKSAAPYENKLFQFFVRAEDKGSPSRHVSVPVEIYIMGPRDVPPVFERKDDKFFISENSAPGTGGAAHPKNPLFIFLKYKVYILKKINDICQLL